MPALNSSVLSGLSPSVAVPKYDRSGLTAGIVHFGVGGFHRAHQAMYLDRLMNAGKAHDWAICGVGVLPGDARMKQVMDSQDCLYNSTPATPTSSTTSCPAPRPRRPSVSSPRHSPGDGHGDLPRSP